MVKWSMPESYTQIASPREVDATIERIATEIITNHSTTNPLFVALLRGAAPFASKLMFAMANQAPDFQPEIDYMMVRTYGTSKHAGSPQIKTNLSPETKEHLAGRPVIVIDDVLDLGITTNFVSEHLKSLGATKVEIAVLAQKNVERHYDIIPTYCGFDAGDKWLVGMGMDDANAGNEAYRWESGIWEKTVTD